MSVVENTAGEMKAAAPVAKIDAPEKAYAEASVNVAEAPKAEKAAPATKAVAAPKKAPVAKKAAKPAATPKIETPTTNPVIKLKDTIMTTDSTATATATAKEVFADVQTRAKTAYAKGTELTTEATAFAEANFEAVVESGKIFFAGAQELLKDNVETGKTVIETVTEDAKKVAAVKSPTELFQLQGEIARRNFDAVVAYGPKRTEAWVKLYNDAFAPISNRVSVAAEKIKMAA
jgi:phasin family protein